MTAHLRERRAQAEACATWSDAAEIDVARRGEGGGAVERDGRDVNGGDLPPVLGEMDGVLPCPAGEVEDTAGREKWKAFEEEGIGLRRGMEGWIGVAGVPSVGGGRHG